MWAVIKNSFLVSFRYALVGHDPGQQQEQEERHLTGLHSVGSGNPGHVGMPGFHRNRHRVGNSAARV
jgi:hypothetical protein